MKKNILFASMLALTLGGALTACSSEDINNGGNGSNGDGSGNGSNGKYILATSIVASNSTTNILLTHPLNLLLSSLARFLAAFLDPSGSLSFVIRYTKKHRIPLTINR